MALWNPSHRSRVNSGQRFNRGFVPSTLALALTPAGGTPIEC